MHPLLERLLHKQKIDSITELRADERADFDRMQKTLSPEPITVETILALVQRMSDAAEVQMEDLNNSELKNHRLIERHILARKLKEFITGPNREKEALEAFLTAKLDE